MKIEIVNFGRFNPRKDSKSHTWFRLENSWYTDPEFFDFSNDQKVLWIALLSEASKKKSGCITINVRLLALVLKIDPAMVSQTVAAFAAKGWLKHDDETLRDVTSSNFQVTSSNSDVPASNGNATYGRTDVRTNISASGGVDGISADASPGPVETAVAAKTRVRKERARLTTWDTADPLAKVFGHLTAWPKYAAIFDREKDRKTVQEHLDHYGLSVADMEQVAYELRHWADGPNGEKSKSPRGTLATFVRSFVDRREKQKAANGSAKPGHKQPIVESREELRRERHGN